ncbi:MAG: arsenite methyltransferase [Thermodesulfobacteriota bacterium]|nr:arsenite methyltransferase [Thermodesulfobacteriota bacterium]
MDHSLIKKAVQDSYGRIARSADRDQASGCCGPLGDADCLCGGGYSGAELSAVPKGAILGLGCGNPIALAAIQPGQTVLDLGSGAGLDCFLAAAKVGPAGRVIGVDMTSDMVERARENAGAAGADNVEFRLGKIERLPLADQTVDVAISNCVINLAPDKGRVFKELYRVLKPGGRFLVSDIVLTRDLPEAVAANIQAHTACIAGAVLLDRYLELAGAAGFINVRVVGEQIRPTKGLVFPVEAGIKSEQAVDTTGAIASVNVQGTRPG